VFDMKKPVRVGATFALALCLAAPFRTVSADILEQVLVKVNGDIFTKTDLETRQIAAIRGRINSQVDADALKNDAQLKQMLAEVTPRILVDAIDELLMLQLGKEKGYRATDQQFKDWVGDIRKNQGLDDEQKFQAALKQEGMTMEDLRRNFERQVVIYRVQQDEVGPKLQITEEEARQYYLSHQQEFVTPSQVTLREILIEVPTATQGGQKGINVGQEDDAKQKAETVRGRLSAGEDFVKVASEVSASPSKANGGLIGPIDVKELSQNLQQLLDKMKPGEITQPLRVAKGYQILKLETKTTQSVRAFDSVRDIAAEKVYGERQRGEVRKFLERLRSQALIVWKNEDLKNAYEQAVKRTEPAGLH
jgi:peptidyl-prolyl cis-trans isomerase SurA